MEVGELRNLFNRSDADDSIEQTTVMPPFSATSPPTTEPNLETHDPCPPRLPQVNTYQNGLLALPTCVFAGMWSQYPPHPPPPLFFFPPPSPPPEEALALGRWRTRKKDFRPEGPGWWCQSALDLSTPGDDGRGGG